ncbi:hypothetical protein D9M68_623250 [compost metagenome]
MIDDALGQMARRRGAVHHGVDVQPRWAQVARQQGLENSLLAVEVRIQPPLGQPCAQGDVVHPGACIAGLREFLQRGIEDLPDPHGLRKTTTRRVHPAVPSMHTMH